MADYIPMFLLFAVAMTLVMVFFLGAAFLGPKNPGTSEHNQPFECGNDSSGSHGARPSVTFYMTAILFVVFDVEAVFLYPWAVRFRALGWTGFLSMLGFLAVLVVGLTYVWKKGALEWEK